MLCLYGEIFSYRCSSCSWVNEADFVMCNAIVYVGMQADSVEFKRLFSKFSAY